MKTIVFDFDKTLTYKDTMNQLFFLRMKGMRSLYWPIYLFLVFLVKLRLITTKKLKETSIKFLLPKHKEKIIETFKDFSKMIILADTIVDILNKNIKAGNRVIILSASPIYYLRELFPKAEIIGTTFEFGSDMKFKKIAEHPYGKEKLNSLIRKGIINIDEMYYDSKADEEIFSLCTVAHKINKGNIIKTTQIQ